MLSEFGDFFNSNATLTLPQDMVSQGLYALAKSPRYHDSFLYLDAMPVLVRFESRVPLSPFT